ncbi:MAG: DEAD/DEAH box helicase [Alphaproteobacteria bacterium]|nr:DEAD/DEAH box helicase [Alphaproteobacteria bacterium]
MAAYPDSAARLLRAAGGRQALVESLPLAAQRVLRSNASDLNVATLCLDVHGPGALRALQHALESQGLRPPQRWGTDDARQFVLALGFPLTFAGAANPRPAAELTVAGPRPLPPLHDYQEAALGELLRLISTDADRRRAVLSLPTGAGKTRVAVEAATRSVLVGDRPLVLWVAQTEELAEQAIEAFRHVWAVEGLEATDLRVVRFWGGQRTPHEADDAQPTVVVALVQTLDARMEQDDASWLSIASLVVIDESHHGIAPSYTRLLNHVGVTTGSRQAARTKGSSREPVLLGLSATPFRSSGEEESVRLAARFDAKVIPWQQHDLYLRLREGGMLSRVDMSQLDIPEPFSLTPGEVELFSQYGEIPESALVRLAGVEGRNQAILSTIEAASERSILVFANSVDHAVELTARLSLRGIRARAVSGDTDRSARRDAISAFKRGEVRAICNAVVFATGFDAP